MRLSLAGKISATVVGVLLLALVTSTVAIVSAYRFEELQNTLVADNLASVRAAEELEIALLEQRGYVSSYILDNGSGDWLVELRERGQSFDEWLAAARRAARTPKESEVLDELAAVHEAYLHKRDEVVTLFHEGRRQEAVRVLLTDVVALYQQAYELCEEFLEINQVLVDSTTAQARRQVEQVTYAITALFGVTMALGGGLLWLFFRGVLLPLRRLAADVRVAAGSEHNGQQRGDELRELGHFLQLLMADVAETRHDLESSRSQLAQAEKLAAVGKLAASVAHEIRNPLTSMKMWLFSLRRAVGAREDLREKVDVVSEEIGRLENVVRHFLEFARPPQLKLARQDLTRVLGKTIELVQHRLADQHIDVVQHSETSLPAVMIDTDQMRQVFLNLIENAIEAMPAGGRLELQTDCRRHGGRQMVLVEIRDEGPGMSEEVRQRMFEPFFTTKSEGTGLGLCIAASIVARHGGSLVLDSEATSGTTWQVWIPTQESLSDE